MSRNKQQRHEAAQRFRANMDELMSKYKSVSEDLERERAEKRTVGKAMRRVSIAAIVILAVGLALAALSYVGAF